ncbi:hypothetical protein E2562_010055 [Oryza meyeriana var. granulata]|uniref:Rhodanese domain-containing protein n=1 Tax=Oryza meyeriana var. granulata TaxID=110450 RepID=A0A6G1EHT1_9ORYZ|nr:hypothetical protein E2562_010055 [Oryza meyeriana var. granulata]
MAATASLSHLLLASKPNPSPLPSRGAPALLPLPRRGQRPAPAISAAASDLLSAAPSLKSRLAAGESLYGLFLLSFSPTLAELAALAGYDYVVVDMEHGPGGIPEALACLRALDAARTPAVIRLPEACPVWAKKALDLGPAGLMLPAVESPAAAAAAVSHCRYPPRGVRGAAHPIVRASAYGLDDSYLSRCEDETLIICQVETAAGIAEVDAIAAVDGVDVVQMGPLDLSASMGYLWDPGNRKVRARLREAEKKVLDARKKVAASDGNVAYLGGFAMPNDPAEQLKLRGYHMVAGAVDIGMFRKAALEDVKRFKEAVMEIGEEGDEEDNEKKDKEDDEVSLQVQNPDCLSQLLLNLHHQFRYAAEEDWKIKRQVLVEKRVRSVDVKEALRLQKENNFTILDVRPEADFKEAHPPGAINVQIYRLIKEWTAWDIARRAAFAFFGIFAGTEENPEFIQSVDEKLGKDAKIIVACSTGGTLKPTQNFPDGKQSRSLIAAYLLVLNGYKNVFHLDGGLYTWFKEGLPAVEGEE